MDYLIGQRLIHEEREIVTVVETPYGCMTAGPFHQWVRLNDGAPHCARVSDLQPLPNGQL